jgi:hypothetical protein
MVARVVQLTAVVFAIVAVTITALAAHGLRRPPPPRTNVAVQLEDEEGRRLDTFVLRGQTFVLGRHGQRYNVRITNHGATRVEAVPAVDGRDAVSGQVSNPGGQRGYVVPAGGSVLVPGFRTSLDSVAAFRFTDPSNSYSTRMGTPQRVGIVQVAVFDERVIEPRPLVLPDERRWRPELEQRDGPLPAEPPTATSKRPVPDGLEPDLAERRTRAGAVGRIRPPLPDGNLGTEFGEQRVSRVLEVDFARANPSRPSQWITLRYDDERGLADRGILVRPVLPHGLPLMPDPSRFAPPPPPPISPWDLPLTPGSQPLPH